MSFNAEAARTNVEAAKAAPLNRLITKFVEPASKKGKNSVKLRYWVNKRKREFLEGLGFTVTKTTEDLPRGKQQKFTTITW